MKKTALERLKPYKDQIKVFLVNFVFWLVLCVSFIWLLINLPNDLGAVYGILYWLFFVALGAIAVAIYSYFNLRGFFRSVLITFLAILCNFGIAMVFISTLSDNYFRGSDAEIYSDLLIMGAVVAILQLVLYAIMKIIVSIALAISKYKNKEQG